MLDADKAIVLRDRRGQKASRSAQREILTSQHSVAAKCRRTPLCPLLNRHTDINMNNRVLSYKPYKSRRELFRVWNDRGIAPQA